MRNTLQEEKMCTWRETACYCNARDTCRKYKQWLHWNPTIRKMEFLTFVRAYDITYARTISITGRTKDTNYWDLGLHTV